jgi:hypothetical protein
VCHLRDIEELFLLRFRTMLSEDEPTILVLGEMPPDREAWGIVEGEALPLDPDRWAEGRQYSRTDTGLAPEALRRPRGENCAVGSWAAGRDYPVIDRRMFRTDTGAVLLVAPFAAGAQQAAKIAELVFYRRAPLPAEDSAFLRSLRERRS